LGLAITRRIVDFHAGRISVASELEKGTTFNIVLPIEKL
jgi:signal transduction histidine kinase